MPDADATAPPGRRDGCSAEADATAEPGPDIFTRGWRSVVAWVEGVTGGPERARAVTLLACVLALDSADKGTVSAVAVPLKRSLHIGNAELGLIVTLVSVVGLVFTIPMGMLVDRINRVRLLAVAVALWAVAMVAGGSAPSYGVLLVSRLGLGVVVSVAGPGVASLAGDLFAPSERGRIYGYILAGELVGTGAGLLFAGELTAVTSWRWAFWLLAIPALVLARVLWRSPEPERGGASRLEPVVQADGAVEAARPPEHEEMTVEHVIEEAGVGADESQVLRDPADVDLWAAVRHVLGIRTNVILIIASATGYFFFTGLRTFALVFARDRYGLAQGTATGVLLVLGIGALAGVLLGGRLGDSLLHRGQPAGRVTVAALCPLVAVAIIAPGLLADTLWVAVVLFTLAAVVLAGANPPLDAARLDIMPAALWGRAESVRTVLRTGGEALAPVLFGAISEALAGPHGRGLQLTFLVMLLPLAGSGLILWRARRTYPRDVATAVRSAEPPD